MPSDEMVEKVAEALYMEGYGRVQGAMPWAKLFERTKEVWRASARTAIAAMGNSQHLCGHAHIQSYTGQVELVPPPQLARDDGRGICVDVCLALEITELWRHGIRTAGCCCGHGEGKPWHPYIGVVEDDIPTMKALGYQAQENSMRPGAEDSFWPKSIQPKEPTNAE